MRQVNVDFEAFRFDQYFWVGTHPVPWLDSEAFFIIDSEEGAIPEKQRSIVEFVCKLRRSTRGRLQEALFESYQSEVFDSTDEERTPRLTKPAEIWKLLSEPGIKIPPVDEISSEKFFAVSFACVWDGEHGLAVLFNDRGQPIDIGGSTDFF